MGLTIIFRVFIHQFAGQKKHPKSCLSGLSVFTFIFKELLVSHNGWELFVDDLSLFSLVEQNVKSS